MAQDSIGRPYDYKAPYYNAASITPSDTVDLTYVTRAIYVGGAGNVTYIPAGAEGNAAVTITAPPVGTVLPVAASRVKATGTTATLLVALW